MVMTTILAILFGLSLIYILLYRKQINDFVRQIRFHAEEDSNIEITAELKNRSIKKLQDELNALLETQKRQRLMYEKREEKINQMVTDISHDIRTPLTSISGYFQLLDMCETEEEKAHYEEIISQRLLTLQTMIDEFFTYTKAKQNNQSVVQELCDVRQILCETMFLFYDDLNASGLQVNLEIPEERMERCGNVEELNRIFMNIIKNILIHGCEEVHVRMKRINQQICVTFENKTQKALPQDLSEVFERFYKGDIARSGQDSTGLGLCIVKELVQKMGGSVCAFSRDAGWFGIEIRL